MIRFPCVVVLDFCLHSVEVEASIRAGKVSFKKFFCCSNKNSVYKMKHVHCKNFELSFIFISEIYGLKRGKKKTKMGGGSRVLLKIKAFCRYSAL